MIARIALLLQRHRRAIFAVFLVYAAAIFIMTHWPAWDVRVSYVRRPDLLAHFGVFGLWFGLFWAAGIAGAPLSYASVVRAALISCIYAAIDEGLQGIPWVRRNCAWDDFFANCGGIALAAMAAGVFVYLVRCKDSKP